MNAKFLQISKVNCRQYLFALIAVCVAILAMASTPATYAAHTGQDTDVVAVRVDGVLYSYEQFIQQFGTQDLHWVVDEHEGILTAYTSEEKRDRAVGIRATDILSPDESTITLATTYAILYENIGYTGQEVHISGDAYNLAEQNFDNKASSVHVWAKPIILYQLPNMAGCDLYIQKYKDISDLRDHTLCGRWPSNWNDRASSVKVVN
jgi:hypothetical protein